MDIRDIEHKIENGGMTEKGKLSAEEFNTILDAVVRQMKLSGHDDIDAAVDGEATDDVALVKAAGSSQWTVRRISDIAQSVDISTKFGDATYADGTISFLDEPGGVVLQTIVLSGTIYNINIATDVAQVFSVLTEDEHKYITITPTTSAGAIGHQSEDFPEGYSYIVAVDTGSGFVNRFAGNIRVGESATIDIRSSLVTGQNRIRISVTGDQSATTKTRILTATLTNLMLRVAHTWQTPWTEGSDYAITGIYFQGNIPKTLHVKVNNTEYTKDYRANESFPTISTSYNLYAADFPELESSAVIGVEMWMTGESVTTEHIFLQVMCVKTDDNTPLVCINEVEQAAVNFTQGRLFGFAVYRASSVEIAPSVQANGTYILPTQTVTAIPGQQYSFATSLEVETEEESGTFIATVTPYDGTTAGLAATVSMPLDNSHAFIPTQGAVFYMNAALRTNTESDRLNWKNTAAGARTIDYPTVMTGFTFSKDAWATDPEGHKAFVVPARCRCEVPLLKPFAASGGMMGTTGITVEMLVRCSNIGNYDEPVLSIAQTVQVGTGNRVYGLQIFPTKIVMLGSNEQSEVLQGVGLKEDKMTHVAVVLQRNYADNAGMNLCSVYINGIPNVSFAFASASSFGNGALVIGQDSADFYLYSMRIFDKALDGQAVKADMLNAIIDGVVLDREETRAKDAITDGTAISYQLVKNLGYNIMVVDTGSDAVDIPSFDNKITVKDCTVRFEYWSKPEWNVQIEHVPVDGQGTTSKQYFRWNLRGKIADNSVWTYADGTTATGKKGYMDGGAPTADGHPHLMIDRFTAKKNVASMPQGHKMGATALYDDLFTELGMKNELPNPQFRVAVWQYPFFGFRRYENGAYEFIGLYTAGPDKGCKTSFGYDKKTYPDAMCIEGPNHAPRGTRFLHPWVDVDYDYANETLTIGGEEAWDCDYCKFDTDTAEDKASVLALYEREWKPAYDFVFHTSPYIEALSDALAQAGYASVEAMNADISTFIGKETNGTSNALLSFYDTNYDIWFYRTKTGKFEKLVRQDGDTQDGLWNIKTYLGLTGSPTTSDIKAARTAKFREGLSNFYFVDQTIYHKCFCLLIGAKDNDAKNSYPFKHRALTSSEPGNRWGWKQDDLDSIFDVDNNGQSTVEYWVEPGDKVLGVDIFQGSNSAFWYHVWIAYQDEIRQMFQRFETALSAMAARMGIEGAQSYESAYNVLAHYFFGNSAKYFPITAYQEDRTWTYITPWVKDPNVLYNNVRPLTQAIGDRYLDESYWIERRIMYLFSKYRIGAFTSQNPGWNIMSFTVASRSFTFNVEPALAHYPVASVGGGGDIQGQRTFPGQSTGITLSSDGTTTLYIKATDWLAYLGDLKNLVLTSRGGSEEISFAVVSQRMKKVKVGDADSAAVLFNATELTVAGPCIEEIDARNVVSLKGEVNLKNCPRLRRALFGGCQCSIALPQGSRVEEVSFPSGLTSLVLHSLVYLSTENISIPTEALTNIGSYYYENCPNLNPLAVVERIFSGETNNLENVTIIINGSMEITAGETEALYQLAIGDYGRLDYDDGSVTPSQTPGALVQGTITTEGMFQRQYDAITAAFPDLTVIAQKIYLEFEDAEVWRICCINWGDYNEVVTTISNGTTTIVTTPVSMLNTTARRETSTTVTRPEESGDTAGTVKVPIGITQAQCAAVSSLGTVRFTSSAISGPFHEFVFFTGLSSMPSMRGSTFTGITVHEGIERIGIGVFDSCSKLEVVNLPSTITSFGNQAFYGCYRMKALTILAVTPPTLGEAVTLPPAGTIYVPAGSVDAYKAAWSSYASRIQAIP